MLLLIQKYIKIRFANSTVCQNKWKPIVEPCRAKAISSNPDPLVTRRPSLSLRPEPPSCNQRVKKVREKSRECHNHKLQPFPDKRRRKPTNPNKHKSIKHTKSTKINSLFPKRDNRNAKKTEKHKNKMAQGKTYNKSPRRITHKAPKSKTNTGLPP